MSVNGRQITQNVLSRRAASNGFSIIFREKSERRTKPPSMSRPGSVRAFRGVRAPKFLGIERNIRKSHFPTHDVREHFV